MIRATLAALVASMVLLSGCLAPGATVPEAAAVVDETLPAVDATFHFGPDEGAAGLSVAASVWLPPGETTRVVLGIHGSGGAKDGYGSIPVPGYSFAHNVVGEGRAFVAIDLPGYGESAASTAQTMEDMALVVDRVADALRSGAYDFGGGEAPAFDVVVGLGISMGGLLVQMAQAEHESFEGVISGSWSYGGFSERYQDCFWRGTGCPENMLETQFYVQNVAPAVLDWLNESGGGPRPLGPVGAASIYAWAGCVVTPGPRPRVGTCETGPAFEERVRGVTEGIRVPLLLVFGDEDYYWEPASVADEPSRFPNADLQTITLADTGHLYMWHLSKDELHAGQNAWLDEHGF